MAWLRRQPEIPLRQFVPEHLTFPFTFPVIAVHDDATVLVHFDPHAVALVPEHVLRRAEPPKIHFIDRSFRKWCPVKILSASDSQKPLFGRRMFLAEFQFGDPDCSDQATLAATITKAIQNDPDDLWDQHRSREERLHAVSTAVTFDDLVRALS